MKMTVCLKNISGLPTSNPLRLLLRFFFLNNPDLHFFHQDSISRLPPTGGPDSSNRQVTICNELLILDLIFDAPKRRTNILLLLIL